jgi:hypothetical protein
MDDGSRLLLALTRFSPERQRTAPEAWLEMARLAPPHGVAPLIAYQLEYRLAGSGAPQEVRDALLGHYQGALADNVYKLVNLKKLLAEAPGRRVMLLDAAAVADALYPHVAFRPVPELRLLIQAADVEPVIQAFGRVGFHPRPTVDPLGAAHVLGDDRTEIMVHTRLFPEARQAEEVRLWERAIPHRAYGEGAVRPEAEDVLLTCVLLLARRGFDSPLLNLIDVRELVRGSPDLAGPYSRRLEPDVVLARAAALKLERALWVAMELVAALYPEVSESARALTPPLRQATQALLRPAVIEPAQDLHRTQTFRGAARLRVLLAGG